MDGQVLENTAVQNVAFSFKFSIGKLVTASGFLTQKIQKNMKIILKPLSYKEYYNKIKYIKILKILTLKSCIKTKGQH